MSKTLKLPNALRLGGAIQRLAQNFVKIWPFILLLAALHQGAKSWYAQNMPWGPDMMLQIAATENFLAGKGISTTNVNNDDLSATHDTPLVLWPPGYTLLLAPLLSATQDPFLSAILLEWLAITIFFGSWWAILRLLPIEDPIRFFVAVFWALGICPLQDVSTGMLANAFYSAALAVLLYAIRRDRAFARMGILSGILFASSAVMRYQYWPLVVVMPITLAWAARRFDRRLGNLCVYHSATALLLLLGMALFQKTATGSYTYVETAQRTGWFPSNLAAFYPFPAFTLKESVEQLSQNGNLPNIDYTSLLHGLTLLITILYCWFTWRWGGKRPMTVNRGPLSWTTPGFITLVIGIVVVLSALRVVSFSKLTNVGLIVALLAVAMLFPWGRILGRMRPAPPVRDDSKFLPVFYMMGFLTMIITVAMLAYLSLRHAPDPWTYVQEYRYFAPLQTFLLVGLLHGAYASAHTSANWTGTAVLTLVLIVCAVPLLAAGDFSRFRNNWKVVISATIHDTFETRRFGIFGNEYVALWDILSSAKETDRQVVFFEDKLDYTTFYVRLKGANVVAYDELIAAGSDQLHAEQGLTLVALIPAGSEMMSPLADFCRRNNATKIGTLPLLKKDIVRLELEPRRSYR